MPVWNDDFMPIEEFDEQSSVPWYVILIIIVVVAVGVIVSLKTS